MLAALFGRKSTRHQTNSVIDAQTLHNRMQNNDVPIVIDVRSAEEFASGHIPGARLLPLNLLSIRHHEIPKDRPVVIACRSGARSSVAIKQLKRLGYDNVSNLSGGLLAWRRAGYPIA